MSIANNIDGSSGSTNQLFDLLTVVSNPAVYQTKLKALEDATAEHKKYVELVGPASDILALKEKAKKDAQEAANVLDSAKQQATGLISDAKAQSSDIVAVAKTEASKLKADAQDVMDAAKLVKTQADSAAAQAVQAQAKADANLASAAEKSKLLDKAIADANAAKEGAEALKAEIVAKQKAFIESL
jgi:cell division septum initiation protein DivIVA